MKSPPKRKLTLKLACIRKGTLPHSVEYQAMMDEPKAIERYEAMDCLTEDYKGSDRHEYYH